MKQFKNLISTILTTVDDAEEIETLIAEDIYTNVPNASDSIKHELKIAQGIFHKEIQQLQQQRKIQKSSDPKNAEKEYQRNSKIIHDRYHQTVHGIYVKHGLKDPSIKTLDHIHNIGKLSSTSSVIK